MGLRKNPGPLLIDTLCDLPTYERLHQLLAEMVFKKDLRGYLAPKGQRWLGKNAIGLFRIE